MRIDFLLLPLFLITQTLQYLDKTALNYAKVFGMEKAMGMTGNDYSLGAAIFYIGYMVAQPGWSYLLGKWHAGRVLGVSASSGVSWSRYGLEQELHPRHGHSIPPRCLRGRRHARSFAHDRLVVPPRRGSSPTDHLYSAVGWGGMIGSLMAAAITFVSFSVFFSFLFSLLASSHRFLLLTTQRSDSPVPRCS